MKNASNIIKDFEKSFTILNTKAFLAKANLLKLDELKGSVKGITVSDYEKYVFACRDLIAEVFAQELLNRRPVSPTRTSLSFKLQSPK